MLTGVAGGVGGHHPSLVGSLGVKLSWNCLKNMQNRKASWLMESGTQGRAQGKQGPGTDSSAFTAHGMPWAHTVRRSKIDNASSGSIHVQRGGQRKQGPKMVPNNQRQR